MGLVGADEGMVHEVKGLLWSNSSVGAVETDLCNVPSTLLASKQMW